MTARVRYTPFHLRWLPANPSNAWQVRGGYTVPSHFGSAEQEALAGRISAVLADITPLQRLRIRGQGAADLLSTACGRDLRSLAAGQARAVAWRSDGGGVRGLGTIARLGGEDYRLIAEDADAVWFAAAAPRFGVAVENLTGHQALLALVGPLAAQVLAAAGLAPAAQLETMQHRILSWRGLIVIVSRWRGLGYEIGCMAQDAAAVFDRLMRAGARHALLPAGQEALDILALEHGIVSPWRDFAPARDAFAREPAPALVGFSEVSARRVLAAFEAQTNSPLPLTAVYGGTRDSSGYSAEFRARVDAPVGEVVRSLWSPALRRVIGYALLDNAFAAPGTALVIRRLGANGVEEIAARTVALPFLPAP